MLIMYLAFHLNGGGASLHVVCLKTPKWRLNTRTHTDGTSKATGWLLSDSLIKKFHVAFFDWSDRKQDSFLYPGNSPLSMAVRKEKDARLCVCVCCCIRLYVWVMGYEYVFCLFNLSKNANPSSPQISSCCAARQSMPQTQFSVFTIFNWNFGKFQRTYTI